MENNETSTKNKKKKKDINKINTEDEINNNRIYHPTIINQNNPIRFDTGFYFNNNPANIVQNKFYENDANSKEFVNDFLNQTTLNNQEQMDISYDQSLSNQGKSSHNINSPNTFINPNNLNDIYLNKMKKDHFGTNYKNNNDKNSQKKNVLKSTVNKLKACNNEIPVFNQIPPQSIPNLIPAFGFPINFNANNPMMFNPLYSNINNPNILNPYFVNQNNSLAFSNINENPYYPNPLNFQNPIQNAIQKNNVNNNKNVNNYINSNLYFDKGNKTSEKSNLDNNGHLYNLNGNDEIIDKNEFLNEFADLNNFSGNKPSNINNNININNYSKGNKYNKTNKDSKYKLKDESNLVENLFNENILKNKNKTSNNITNAIIRKEESDLINFDNFKDVIVKKENINKESNNLTFNRKQSKPEEMKEEKNSLKNNSRGSLINGLNIVENSVNTNDSILKNNEIINNMHIERETIQEKSYQQKHSIAGKTSIKKDKEFSEYLKNPESSTIKLNQEEKYKKENSVNNNKLSNIDFAENEFYDFNKIVINNSIQQTPNITSDYYAYKFTSVGENLKLDLNFDGEFYGKAYKKSKQKVELFIPIDEDDFNDGTENINKKQEEDQKRHSLKVIKRSCGNGSQININISQNEYLSENFDKEFGDSYGPKKSNLI